MTHQYGAFTWFNADQEGVIDDTGGFWEGENYIHRQGATRASEAAQENLLPGQTQGWVPDLHALRPGHRPGHRGRVRGHAEGRQRTVKVKPVWEHYKARAAEFAPEIAAEITGIPAQEIVDAGHGLRHPHRPVRPATATAASSTCSPSSTALQRHPELPAPWTTSSASPATSTPRAATAARPSSPSTATSRASAPGLRRLHPARPRSTSSRSALEKFPLLGWWAVLVRRPDHSTTTMVTGDPYPVRALWNESGNFMSFANYHDGVGGASEPRLLRGLEPVACALHRRGRHHPARRPLDRAEQPPRLARVPPAPWARRSSACSRPRRRATIPRSSWTSPSAWGYEWNPSDPDNLWPDIQWQLDDSIKLLSDDEWPYQEWTVENGKVVKCEQKGTPLAEMKPKYSLGRVRCRVPGQRLVAGQGRRPEAVGHLPSLPDRRHPRP